MQEKKIRKPIFFWFEIYSTQQQNSVLTSMIHKLEKNNIKKIITACLVDISTL